MLEADRAALSASVQQGFLAIREKELQLYNSQLNAVGTQAALIAGFSFTGLFVGDNAETEAVNYLFFFFAALSLMTALYTVCHATFVSVWAPSLALRGDSPEAVAHAIDTIKRERNVVFISGFVSIISFALASIFLSWMFMPDGPAGIATIILFVGIAMTIKVGFDVRDKFNRKRVNQMIAAQQQQQQQQRTSVGYNAPSRATKDSSIKAQPAYTAPTAAALAAAAAPAAPATAPVGGGGGGGAGAGASATTAVASPTTNRDSVGKKGGKKLAIEILQKQDEYRGGALTLIFLVVEKGFMHIYKSKRDYLEHRDPMNDHPIVLHEYRIDTDVSKYITSESGIASSIRRAVTGSSELRVIDYYLNRTEKDEVLNPQLRFALQPIVEDELRVRTPFIFQPADESMRQRCLDVLSEYTSAEELKPTVDTFIHLHST